MTLDRCKSSRGWKEAGWACAGRGCAGQGWPRGGDRCKDALLETTQQGNNIIWGMEWNDIWPLSPCPQGACHWALCPCTQHSAYEHQAGFMVMPTLRACIGNWRVVGKQKLGWELTGKTEREATRQGASLCVQGQAQLGLLGCVLFASRLVLQGHRGYPPGLARFAGELCSAGCAPGFLQTLPDTIVLVQRKKADDLPIPLICNCSLSSWIN